ncbi:2-oxoglutarate and iron-dependent oxygenase JMJD4 [Battus philenor]|uniref:2-oxoglutarate and iron-dependent oxygenase JMJD4 n=1 Tax=Battus philenor TaxID=42288 RepID=UPI0035CF8A7C
MKVKDYMLYLKNDKKENLLYLKDWHLRRMKPDHNFYEVPRIFASDWLNEFAMDTHDDDFMFVYIGPENSWTPLHCDVYSSYSWSVNIIGRKKWILFPPGEEDKLMDSFGNLPLLFNPEQSIDVKYFEIIQERGDAIFVPSGWHHEVYNVHDTISINHNFINGGNLGYLWKALEKNLLSVENEIEEFRDSPEFINQCQLILKSVFGMDYISFMTFVMHIGNKRIRQFTGEDYLNFQKYLFGKKHVIFDLHIVLKLLYQIQQHPLFESECPTSTMKENLLSIIKTIKTLLN